MPSANPKLEKQASTEAVEPIRQAIIAIEHKIRNLEKRKGRLESYRDLQKNGKELNHDQKTAVAKYDEVLQTLDFTRDLCKHIVGIANDAAKQQKKLARKEALERVQQDIIKVREVLLIQDALANMGAETVREDFLAGVNGAVKLTEDELKFLDDLYGEVTVKHQTEEGEPPFVQQVQKAAEHFVAIVDGKQREIVGTTYNKLKEIITSIQECGYFDQVQQIEEQVEELIEPVTEEQLTEPTVQEPISEDYSSSDRHIPPPESMIPIPNFPVQVASLPVPSGPPSVSVPVPGPVPVVQQPIPGPVDTAYYANPTASYAPPPQQPQQQPPPQAPRINDVIGTPNFFFLQESELDSPDVTTQQQAPIVSHIPPIVNAPIPTQTFTNQNFSNPPNVVPQQVMFQHQPPPPQDMPHIAGFANNPNPPPPIPMPPSHQQPNIQYSPQHPAGFQQQQVLQQNFEQTQPQSFDSTSHQQVIQQQPSEEKTEQVQDEPVGAETDLDQGNESLDWSQMTEGASGDWNQPDPPQQSVPLQQPQQQAGQQAWGDQQRGGYRGRGGRRGNTNGYNSRGRGGGYQQNGRGGGGGGSGGGGNGAGSGQGSYYRNNDNSYQNGGYQPRNHSNDGTSGFSGGFKRGSGGQRGGPRGERGGMDRGGRGGGQFRGGQRGGSRGGYAPRGKPQQTQQ